MVDELRITSRNALATPSNFLDFVPIRQQPGLEIVLRGVRVESGFRPDPMPHLVLRISGVRP